MGAEVIHIESATRPDLIRLFPPYANGQATSHSYLNRNKQSSGFGFERSRQY